MARTTMVPAPPRQEAGVPPKPCSSKVPQPAWTPLRNCSPTLPTRFYSWQDLFCCPRPPLVPVM